MIASAILRMVRDANELVKADALEEGLTVEAQKLQVQRELLAAQQQALEKDETAAVSTVRALHASAARARVALSVQRARCACVARRKLTRTP